MGKRVIFVIRLLRVFVFGGGGGGGGGAQDIRVLSKILPLSRWPNGLASQRKFAKPELAYGLAKGGQTDSQVGLQVAKNRKFHAYH